MDIYQDALAERWGEIMRFLKIAALFLAVSLTIGAIGRLAFDLPTGLILAVVLVVYVIVGAWILSANWRRDNHIKRGL